MNDIKEIIKIVVEKGWAVVPIIALILIILKPDRAEKLKEIIFLPIYRLLKLGSRQYIASKINYTCTEFFNQNVHRMLPSSPSVKVRIKWVNLNDDAILKQDGTLVLCMRERGDQTRNILAATQIALPQVVCPTVRPRIAREASAAVDLVLLRRLANGLGKHAIPVYQKYFLGPALEDTPEIQIIFQHLVELDQSGTFIIIFLEELNVLGDILYFTGDLSDKTEAFHGFLNYLLEEAGRADRQEIPLDYFSKDFKVGIIILAISEKAKALGVTPYLAALDRHIKLGCDSIYLIAYQHAFELLDRFLKAVEADERVSFYKNVTIRTDTPSIHLGEPKRIALLQRKPMFSDTTFEEKVRSAGIVEGAIIEGKVMDISDNKAIIDVLGMNGIINRVECSWNMVFNCADILVQDTKRKFYIKKVDLERNILELSLKLPDEDPWKMQKVPSLGDLADVAITYRVPGYLLGYTGAIELSLPWDELSWTTTPTPDEFLNTRQKVIIIKKDDDCHKLIGSLRRLQPNPWPEIQRKMPKGTILRANVLEVTPGFVRVSLPGNLEGIIPKDAMQRAGFEYADYQTTLTKGQGLDVVVTHVFSNKKKIRLDLRRNIEKKT